MSTEDRYQRVNLRIPKELHARIMEAADARSHSMNAEIIQRLEESLNPTTKTDITLAGMDDPRGREGLRDSQGNITVGVKVIDHPTKGHVIRITHINDIKPD